MVLPCGRNSDPIAGGLPEDASYAPPACGGGPCESMRAKHQITLNFEQQQGLKNNSKKPKKKPQKKFKI
jgi:hypothetical protein